MQIIQFKSLANPKYNPIYLGVSCSAYFITFLYADISNAGIWPVSLANCWETDRHYKGGILVSYLDARVDRWGCRGSSASRCHSSYADYKYFSPKFCMLPIPSTLFNDPEPFAIMQFITVESKKRVAAELLWYYYEFIASPLLSDIWCMCNF